MPGYHCVLFRNCLLYVLLSTKIYGPQHRYNNKKQALEQVRFSNLAGESRSAEDAVLCRGVGCPHIFPPIPPQGWRAASHRQIQKDTANIKCLHETPDRICDAQFNVKAHQWGMDQSLFINDCCITARFVKM